MKISYQDRVQAIKNSTIYQKDYKRYEKQRENDGEIDVKIGPPWDPRIRLSKAGKWLCEKWGIRYPIAPDAPLTPLEPDYNQSEKDGKLDATMGPPLDPRYGQYDIKFPLKRDSPLDPVHYAKLKPSTECLPWMIDGSVYPVSFPTEDELKNPSSMSVADSAGYRVVTHLNGKLCFLIDTTYPPDMTMEALREFIKYYAKKTKYREVHPDPKADPWKVYLLHRRGINLRKITKTLHPDDTEHPAYNKTSASHYSQVKRAKSKAYQMIEYVEKEANKSKRLPK